MLAISRYRIPMTVLTEREWRLKKVAPRQVAHSGEITVAAPMPGLVKTVLVAEGDTVAKGQRLLVLEAMKMEHTLTAPFDGKVAELDASEGAQVSEGALLARVERDA